MKEALSRILGSAKFWTTVIGMVMTAGASLFARYGLELSTEAIQQIAVTVAGLFALLLGGQALAGHGKEAAELTAKAPAAQVVVEMPSPVVESVAQQPPVSGEVNS